MNHALVFRILATGGLIGLIVLLGLAYGKAGWIAAIPLMFPVPGVLLNHRYTFAWASMIIIFYLGFLASEVGAPQELGWEIYAASACSLAAFVGCLLYVRLTRDAKPQS